ncbi:MAG TPA: hypothetical protein VIH58_01055, partial [Chthoniobacterales bacterium]
MSETYSNQRLVTASAASHVTSAAAGCVSIRSAPAHGGVRNSAARDTKREPGVTSDQHRSLMSYREQPACL